MKLMTLLLMILLSSTFVNVANAAGNFSCIKTKQEYPDAKQAI
ncbi:hypothetical protein [Nitrosomonas supralitoralis]|nr:hypothetical protein [Nitrosomonas supralitoralis]